MSGLYLNARVKLSTRAREFGIHRLADRDPDHPRLGTVTIPPNGYTNIVHVRWDNNKSVNTLSGDFLEIAESPEAVPSQSRKSIGAS